MRRKTFIKKATGTMLLGIPIYSILSCSGSEEDPLPPNTPAPPAVPKDCLGNGTAASIGSNHGHSVAVSKADVEAAVDKEFSIQGTSGHDHSITVLASHFLTLKTDNTPVAITSTSGNGHTHSVTISCA